MRYCTVFLASTLLLASCDGQSPVAAPAPTPTPTTVTTSVSAEIAPAEVGILRLEDLGIDSSAAVTSVESGSSGISMQSMKIVSGELRIIAPGDTGKDEPFKISLREADGDKFDVAVTMVSTLGSAITTAEDGAGDGETEAAPLPALNITGIDNAGRLTGEAITISIASAPKFSTTASSAYVIDAAGAKQSVGSHWTYDGSTNRFTLSAVDVATLRGALPDGSSTLIVGLMSEDASFAGTYHVPLLTGSAKISGHIVNAAGAAVTTLADRLVGVVGRSNGIRRVAKVDAGGVFSVEGVPTGTYDVQLLDLDAPGFTGGFVAIFTGASTVTAEITYTSPGANPAGFQTAQGVKSGTANSFRFVGARVSNAGISPASRNAGLSTLAVAEASDSCSSTAEGTTTFEVASGPQNQTQTCQVSYIVPQGSGRVQLQVTVSTEEYPTYTKSQSVYDDQWLFTFSGVPDLPPGESDSVNHSHYNSGTLTRTKCLDLTELSKDKSLTIAGALKAVNIGDSVLATKVRAVFKPNGCGLSVTKADLSTKNKLSYKVLLGRNANSLVGPFLPYLSIPQNNAVTTYGIPLEINYAPKDAVLSKVELGVLQNGVVVRWSDDILTQATAKTPGKLTFKDFIFPVMLFNRQNSYLSLTIRLTGTVNGQPMTSPDGEQNLTVAGSTLFAPLYLAGDESALSGLRYNSPHDAGGDSWATQTTIAWLLARQYRFDDVSGLHVARADKKCANKTREGAVLGHCGHSNGQEVDLRYYNPDGTFPEPISESGGTGLSTLLSNAQAAGPTSATTARLVQWITRNRTLIENAAAEPRTLEIWFGKEAYFSRALVFGQYPNGMPIIYAVTGMPDQTVTAWGKAKPEIANPAANHDTHWHISRNSP